MSTVLNDNQAIENVARNVNALLKERKVSQAALARATNESEMNISRLVRGTNMPGAAILARVAEYFGVSVDYLLGKHDKGRGGRRTA